MESKIERLLAAQQILAAVRHQLYPGNGECDDIAKAMSHITVAITMIEARERLEREVEV